MAVAPQDQLYTAVAAQDQIYLNLNADGSLPVGIVTDFGPTNTSATVVTGVTTALLGYAVKETTGSARAVVNIRDGSSGKKLLLITLNEGESTREIVAYSESPLNVQGIPVTSGEIYLEVIEGHVEGMVITR
jgi:hypothetical protein